MNVALSVIQTVTRKSFDPETITVSVGTVHTTTPPSIRVIIIDDRSKRSSTFHMLPKDTLLDLENKIRQAAEAMGLKAGPRKIGNEVVAEDAA